jgi:hypothetical protein
VAEHDGAHHVAAVARAGVVDGADEIEQQAALAAGLLLVGHGREVLVGAQRETHDGVPGRSREKYKSKEAVVVVVVVVVVVFVVVVVVVEVVVAAAGGGASVVALAVGCDGSGVGACERSSARDFVRSLFPVGCGEVALDIWRV